MSEPFQPLEPRRLFAAVVEDGVLFVTGTPDADRITVGLNRRGRVLVTIEQGGDAAATLASVRPQDLDRVQVDGLGGDDVIRLDTLTVPADVRGGDGNDTVYGGLSDDTLSGDAGDDFVSDRRGSDVLIGGAGRDTLRSLGGPDTLLGGSGSDRLIAYADESVLSGGSGTDSATLNGVPDGVSGIERYAGTYLPAANPRNVRGTVSAYENRNGLLLIDTTLSRFGGDFVFDYDLTNADGRFDVSATPFVINPAGPGVSADVVTGRRGVYRRTFSLGLVTGLEPAGFDVSLRSAGTRLYAGNAGFAAATGEFDSDVTSGTGVAANTGVAAGTGTTVGRVDGTGIGVGSGIGGGLGNIGNAGGFTPRTNAYAAANPYPAGDGLVTGLADTSYRGYGY